MQRALSGELSIETSAGEEDELMHGLHKLFPSLFGHVSQRKQQYEIKIVIDRIE